MILSVKDLSLAYVNAHKQISKVLLANLNFDFTPGNFMGLLGKNGSGKTTLLKTLSGVMEPWQGQIYLENHSLYDLAPLARARVVAMVTTVWPSNMLLSGRDVLLLGRYPYLAGLSYRKEDHDLICELAEILKIQDFLDRPFFELSDGQRQKIMIGRALAQKTKFIFLDEPFTYLDMTQKDWLFDFLRKYAHEQQVGDLFSTHDRFIVDQLDTVLALDHKGSGTILGREHIQEYLASF